VLTFCFSSVSGCPDRVQQPAGTRQMDASCGMGAIQALRRSVVPENR
jgi:hypothetical protein